jgi:hypothetical protein
MRNTLYYTVCIYAYIYIDVYVWSDTCKCLRFHDCMYTHSHTHTQVCQMSCIWTCPLRPWSMCTGVGEWEGSRVRVCLCVCLCLCLCVYVCVTRERESVCGCMFGCLYVHVRWYRRKQMLIFTHVSLSYDNALNTHTSIHVYLYTYTGLIHPYVVSLVDQTSGKQTQARQVCRSVCVCVYVCWCVCVYKYVAVCMYVCMCVFRSVIHTYTHISTCVYR